MDNKTQQVLDAIQVAVEERVLSAEGLEAIEALRQDHSDNLRDLELCEEKLSEQEVDLLHLRSDLDKAKARLADIKVRAAEVTEREHATDIRAAELEAELTALTRHEQTLRIIFRAPVIRETITGSREAPIGPDGYTKNQMNDYSTREVREVEEGQ